MFEENDAMFRKIKNLHLAAFIFMGIQAIAYGNVGESTDLYVIMTVGFPKYCDYQTETCSMWGSQPNIKQLGDWNPIWLMTFFVVLASFDHLVSYLYMVKYPESAKEWLFDIGRSRFQSRLSFTSNYSPLIISIHFRFLTLKILKFLCSNPFRMIEYSISASAMALAISILCGISDVHLVFLVFFMTAIGMLIGLVIELLPVDKYYNVTDSDDVVGEVATKQNFAMKSLNERLWNLRKILMGLGWAVIFIPWLVLMCYFFANAKRRGEDPDGGDLPTFVYFAFLGTLVLFIAFGVNSFLCSIMKWYSFPTAEIVYIALSFTAKTFLAADVFGGLNSSNESENNS